MGTFIGWFAGRAARGQDRENLSRIDDRMLADLGISRADVDEELRRLN